MDDSTIPTPRLQEVKMKFFVDVMLIGTLAVMNLTQRRKGTKTQRTDKA
jgi:hypothetical protein